MNFKKHVYRGIWKHDPKEPKLVVEKSFFEQLNKEWMKERKGKEIRERKNRKGDNKKGKGERKEGGREPSI